MAPIYRFALPLGAAAMLSACAANLGEAERTAPPGDAFAAALHKGYVELARAEQTESDFVDARAFADRAIRAAAGVPPAPEPLGARKLPSEALPALADARERLVRALDRGASRTDVASEAARAQLAFDCWLQEQEENIQPADIAACRSEFETALASVESRMTAATVPTPVPERTRTVVPVSPAAYIAPEPAATPLDTRFVVYFDFDKAGVTPATEDQISKAAAAARRTGAAMVRVVGHADRAGTDSHNMTLSRSRAQSVVKALRRLGLPDIGIAIQAMGEGAPAVATADGVREPRNRRVEIELTHGAAPGAGT